ncbi:MAG: hypothetical protein GY847_25870, partial [Proteobacteria bacterium]|nr:hypothetical protein [Pseudomonadota bacterium]
MATLSFIRTFAASFRRLFPVRKFAEKQKCTRKIPKMTDEQKAVCFPLPPRFWENPGDVPSFRLWAVQLENYIFSIDSQRTAANEMTDEFKNRLTLSLLGSEGIASFTCLPEVETIAETSFAAFFATAKHH